jgi:DNA-binding transcriptional regulator LsrR (DeoR family)
LRQRRRTKPDDIRQSPYLLEALQVAYYHCALEMPLKNIAEILGKSPATITRRLEEVRQAGWLKDRPEFHPPPDIWEELQSRMTCTNVEDAIRQAFGGDLLQRITVLPSPVRPDSIAMRSTPAENVERVGMFAARRLADELADGPHVVGVNWGWSVRHCVMNLHVAKPNPDLRFLPIVGNLSLDENDPHYEEALECSSNRLAQHAAAAFGAPRAPRLSTPAFIPRRFHHDTVGLRAIRDFIEGDVSFRRIFGGTDENRERQTGMIEQVDTLVTGLTSLDVQTLPTYRPGLITPEDLPILQRAGVVGDLALHMVTADGNGANKERVLESELVQDINDLIVGASPKDFVRVAEGSRSGGGLGVMVIAVGAWKAKILTTAIRMRAVNELITDLETAHAIGRELGIKEMPAAPGPALGGKNG